MAWLAAAREKRALARDQLTKMVLSSVSSLQEQDVLALQLGVQYANIQKDLVDTDLKIKIRMDDRTVLKTKFRIPCEVSSGSDHVRVSFDTTTSLVYEGARMLHVELCKQNLLGSSSSLACCQVPIEKVLSAASCQEYGQGKALKLDLSSTEKVAASVFLSIGIQTSKLESIGGLDALKVMVVPRMPKCAGGKTTCALLDSEIKEAKAFVHEVNSRREGLLAALDEAIRAAPDIRFILTKSGNSENRGFSQSNADFENFGRCFDNIDIPDYALKSCIVQI
jgi:hypothetical protein